MSLRSPIVDYTIYNCMYDGWVGARGPGYILADLISDTYAFQIITKSY